MASNQPSVSKPPQVTFQQPGPYLPQQQQPQSTHYTQQPHLQQEQQPLLQQVQVVVAAAPLKFQDYPMRMRCPHCSAEVTTSVKFMAGGLTWLVAGGICLVGLFLGCCLIPFCVNSFKDAEHSCTSCGQVVGKYRRLG